MKSCIFRFTGLIKEIAPFLLNIHSLAMVANLWVSCEISDASDSSQFKQIGSRAPVLFSKIELEVMPSENALGDGYFVCCVCLKSFPQIMVETASRPSISLSDC